MFKLSKKSKLNTTETVDIIENIVYEELKPLGFRKFGRTLHRFVSEDISQVINFQVGLACRGLTDIMWVNTGIRVPECSERDLEQREIKKYYHEYECTIRSRLGTVSGKSATDFSLKDSPQKLATVIIEEIRKYVIPAFDVLCDRKSILRHRRDYPNLDSLAYIEIDEVMIYLKMGNKEKAKELFEENYQKQTLKNHIKYLDELAIKLKLR